MKGMAGVKGSPGETGVKGIQGKLSSPTLLPIGILYAEYFKAKS